MAEDYNYDFGAKVSEMLGDYGDSESEDSEE